MNTEQNAIIATYINNDGLSTFTNAMKELLVSYGYTEVSPGEWWMLGDCQEVDDARMVDIPNWCGAVPALS